MHDLGGPVGLHWAVSNPERVTKLALLNTLVYPEFSEAVLAFIKACSEPDSRRFLTSPEGLEAAMRLGIADESQVTDELLAAVREPFKASSRAPPWPTPASACRSRASSRSRNKLPSLEIPVRIVYGEQDPILPDIADTVARLEKDLPQAEVTALPDCGHFLQEEAGEQIGDLLAEFFAD